MTDQEIEEINLKRTAALAKSMKQTFDDVFNKNEDFQKLSPLQQNYVKARVLQNSVNFFGGFKK